MLRNSEKAIQNISLELLLNTTQRFSKKCCKSLQEKKKNYTKTELFAYTSMLRCLRMPGNCTGCHVKMSKHAYYTLRTSNPL